MKTRLERGKRMKRNKGFTLIELLAVIVILAIIALIAVPVVMNIISKANKSAFKDSAYGMLKAGENYYMGELLKAEGMTEDKVFDFSKDTSELEINGSKPTGGTMTVRKDGKIAMAIHNGKHCVTKGFEDDDVTITDDVENCKLPTDYKLLSELVQNNITFKRVNGEDPVDPVVVTKPDCVTNGQKCTAGTPMAIEVAPGVIYKFYVLKDDNKVVTLIMDRNLYSEEDLANETHDVKWSDSETNAEGPLTALATLKTRTAGWINISSYSYILENDEDDGGGLNTYREITGELVTNVRARLPRLEELYSLREANGGTLPSYLIENYGGTGDDNTIGYWTSTANSTSSNEAWSVIYYGDVWKYNVGQYFGVRPVIMIPKVQGVEITTPIYTNGYMTSKDECINEGTCEAGTPVNVKVNNTEMYKFYVLSDTNDKLTMIMDRNLYSAEDLANNTHNVAWMSADDYVDNDSCTYDACNDQGPLTALTALNERTKEWTNIPAINNYEYTNTEGTYGYQKLKIENGLGKLTSKDGTTISEIAGVSRARLLTYEEATSTSIGCTTSSGSCPSWLQENYDGTGDNNTYGYWLLSAKPSGSNSGRNVYYYGSVDNFYVFSSGGFGVRPVITLSK